jgi:hypothetical protein
MRFFCFSQRFGLPSSARNMNTSGELERSYDQFEGALNSRLTPSSPDRKAQEIRQRVVCLGRLIVEL